MRLPPPPRLQTVKAATAIPAPRHGLPRCRADSEYGARARCWRRSRGSTAAAARPLLQEALHDKDLGGPLCAPALLQGTEGPSADAATTMRPAAADSGRLRARLAAGRHGALRADRDHRQTTQGTIEIELADCRCAADRPELRGLARRGFFNGRTVHRWCAISWCRTATPRGDGEGGPGYTIRDELNTRPYLRGTVGMALDWKDTGGSQFFITHSPQPHLDARYTVFGQVISGMDVVDR
jgi:cyclophilin family peptidyl-prolyl cis-trans isomerase